MSTPISIQLDALAKAGALVCIHQQHVDTVTVSIDFDRGSESVFRVMGKGEGKDFSMAFTVALADLRNKTNQRHNEIWKVVDNIRAVAYI